MRNDRYTLDARAAVATGDAFPCKDMQGKTIQVGGPFVATIILEGTIDGVNWVTYAAALAPGIFRILDAAGEEPLLWELRCRTTAYTSGVPLVTLIGHGRAVE